MSRLSFLFLTTFFVGCQKSPPPAVIDESVLQVSRDNNDFAVDLYHKLREKPGNIIFSPYSVSAALAMTYDGARGETAAQMARVLHFPVDRNQLHSPFLNLHRHFVQKPPGFELSIANSLWGDRTLKLQPEFRKNTEEFYGAGLRLVDFRSPSGKEAARRTINDWASNETRGKIPELLDPADLQGPVRLVLTNAIYLNGSWEMPFDERATRPAAFQRADKRTVDVPMMSHHGGQFSYLAEPNFEMLEMPYRGKRASFVVILPKKETPMDRLEGALTGKTIAGSLAKMKPQRIDELSFPRLALKNRTMLRDTLVAMGMPDAFNDVTADFSGISDEALHISKVIHEATLDVDEKGTVAAAATAVVMVGIGEPVNPLHFNANRPFLFLIRDVETGSILFMGRVTDPSVK